MANALSLEERTIVFFLTQTNNVTCYGRAARENVIPFLYEERDYQQLRETFPEGELLSRNPFLGLEGEEAYAIHIFLKSVVKANHYLRTKANHSLRTSLIIFSGSTTEGEQQGVWPIFLELGRKLGVYEQVQQGYRHALNADESMYKDLAASDHSGEHRLGTINLGYMPQRQALVVAETSNLNASETVVCDILAKVSVSSLRGYAQKYASSLTD